MKLTLITPLALVGVARSSVLHERGCDANNCARAVTGTRTGKMPDVSSRRADCSSFLLATITPDTSTSTITITETTIPTITVTTTLTPALVKRDMAPRAITVIPTAVPAYASPCAGPSAYSSACSCWGITGSTTTVPSPTAFTTTTVTVTSTATAAATALASCGLQGCHEPRLCPGSSSQVCECVPDIAGTPACLTLPRSSSCLSYPICTSNAECPTDTRCFPIGANCCQDARCFPIAQPGLCAASQSLPRSINSWPVGEALDTRDGTWLYPHDGSDRK